MRLAKFLAEVSLRAQVSNHFSSSGVQHSLHAILDRLLVYPTTLESQVLLKATLAVIECEGELSDADLMALSKDALRLLDRFAADRLALKFEYKTLNAVGEQLKELAVTNAVAGESNAERAYS